MGFQRQKKEIILTQRERDVVISKNQYLLDAYNPNSLEYATILDSIIKNALTEKEARVKRNKNNRQRGKALEKKLRDELGVERVAYSGSNSEFGWGDLRSPHVLGEAKSIEHKGTQTNIIVLKKDLDDIVKQARQENKIPWYAYRAPRHSQIVVVMTMEDWRLVMTSAGLLPGDNKISIVDGKLMVDDIPYQEFISKRSDSKS